MLFHSQFQVFPWHLREEASPCFCPLSSQQMLSLCYLTLVSTVMACGWGKGRCFDPTLVLGRHCGLYLRREASCDAALPPAVGDRSQFESRMDFCLFLRGRHFFFLFSSSSCNGYSEGSRVCCPSPGSLMLFHQG